MTGGLWVFVVCWALCGAALVLDLWLLSPCGCRTITSYVWQHPSVGLPLLAVPLVGWFGLLNHFYGGE